MKFSVCIPTVRSATLQAAIDSIRRQTWPDWELIVVGQGEDAALDQVGRIAAARDSRIRYLKIMQNGLSRARNAGIEASTGDAFAFMDDDCEAHPEWLATLADGFMANPGAGLVAGSLVAPPPARSGIGLCPSLMALEVLYDPAASGHSPPEGWDWYGANCAIRADVIKTVGLFDDYLGAGSTFGGAEDYDYKFRLDRHEIPMYTTPRAIVYHTYGWRYGLRSFLRLRRSYWRGNGAFVAKLILVGDERGRGWLNHEMRACIGDWLPMRGAHVGQRPRRPNVLRLWYFRQGYQECLDGYEMDRSRGVLRPAIDRGCGERGT